jgi:uncharacterized protein (TIGR03118 family)
MRSTRSLVHALDVIAPQPIPHAPKFSFAEPDIVWARRALGLGAMPLVGSLCVASSGYASVDLVSDERGRAQHSDPRLVNPWGISFCPNGIVFAADNAKGMITLYSPSGIPIPFAIHVPMPWSTRGISAPSGLAFNATDAFLVTEGSRSLPARYLFATRDGTISGWNPTVSAAEAQLVVDNSRRRAVYTGIATGHVAGNERLYAADFQNRKIDVFDAAFASISSPDAFVDPDLPADYAPFGIHNVDDAIVVAYAKRSSALHAEPDMGAGNGIVDVFHADGALVRRIASHGALDAPWSVARAPEGFGSLSGALLVGNCGDGVVNAFDIESDAYLGPIEDEHGAPLVNRGLLGLSFGPDLDALGGHRLYFTAGADGAHRGRLGFVRPIPAGGG